MIIDRQPGLKFSAEKEQLAAERGSYLGRAAEGFSVEDALPGTCHLRYGHGEGCRADVVSDHSEIDG